MKFIIYNPRTYLFDFFLNSLTISLNELNINILIYNNNDNGFLSNDNIDYKNDIMINSAMGYRTKEELLNDLTDLLKN